MEHGQQWHHKPRLLPHEFLVPFSTSSRYVLQAAWQSNTPDHATTHTLRRKPRWKQWGAMDGWLQSAAWEETARQDWTLIKNQNLFLIFFAMLFWIFTPSCQSAAVQKCFVTTDKLIKGSMHEVYTPSHLNQVTIFKNENLTRLLVSAVQLKFFLQCSKVFWLCCFSILTLLILLGC